ncbi:hypothetical protein ACXR2T_10795 [Leucobacter sp. HY1910]
MDLLTTITVAAGAAAAITGVVTTAIATHRIKRANDARRFALESVELVDALLGAGTQVIAAGEIPKDSPAGQQIMSMIEAECDCPNHEGQRRIKHAAEQAKRGEK